MFFQQNSFAKIGKKNGKEKSHQQSVAAQCIAPLQLKYRIIRFFIVNIFVIFLFNSFAIPTPIILIFGKFYWQKYVS
jgi:hypothetical protein